MLRQMRGYRWVLLIGILVGMPFIMEYIFSRVEFLRALGSQSGVSVWQHALQG